MPSDDLNDLATVKALIENGIRPTGLERGSSTQVVEVRGGLVIKYGRLVWKSEFLAMELVRRHTNIPVPEPLSYVSEEHSDLPRRSHTGYLVMTKVPGVPLVDVLEGLGEEACTSISTQLMQYLLQLRKLDSYGQWGMVGKNSRFHQGHFTLAPWSPSGTDRRSLADKPNPCVATCARDIFDYFTAASPPVVSAEERQAALDKIDPLDSLTETPSGEHHGRHLFRTRYDYGHLRLGACRMVPILLGLLDRYPTTGTLPADNMEELATNLHFRFRAVSRRSVDVLKVCVVDL